MSGLEQINQLFAKRNGRARFMPYFAIGYPDYETSVNIIEELAKAGADVIEIGVPFSDPLADGPVIQVATQIALKNGVTLPKCVEAVRELRARGVTIPLLLMSYVNPLISYGLEKLMSDATAAGVSGFIVPDLPSDEAGEVQKLTDQYDLAFIHFLAPTSDEKRIKLIDSMARSFIYMVAVTGVTGARSDEVSDELRQFISRVRAHTKQPLVVGFGIGSPQKAKAVGEIADGIIIGSKLVELAKESPEAVINFAQEVVQTMKA